MLTFMNSIKSPVDKSLHSPMADANLGSTNNWENISQSINVQKLFKY